VISFNDLNKDTAYDYMLFWLMKAEGNRANYLKQAI